MKLLNKLSTLIQAVARGPASKPSKAPADAPASGKASSEQAQQANVEQTAQPARTAQPHSLEGDRVADLLQQKLTSSETASQENEKGD
jgi:hypothetical protein